MMIARSEIKHEKVIPMENSPDKGQDFSGTAKAAIDLRICSKNYSCVVFCPRNAIMIGDNGHPVVDHNLCDGCLICLRECPASAISELKR